MKKTTKQQPKERLTIGYVRVSTGKQELGLEAQQTRIEGNAVSKGTTVDEVISDRESAKDLKRDGMSRLLDMVKAGDVATIIVWKLDRLTRSVGDLSDLLKLFDKHDVALVSLNEAIDTSTATGRMIVKMTTLFSEWERETISERTVEALHHKRSKGERMGCVPYGFTASNNERNAEGKTTVAGVVVAEPTEQYTIQKMMGLRVAGMSFAGVATSLNESGSRTRKGTEWKAQYVFNVLAA